MTGDAVSFKEMMARMEKETERDENTFVPDQEVPQRIQLTNPSDLLKREANSIEHRNALRVQRMDTYSWNRDANGGLDTGFPLFNEALDGGVTTGLILFAASPNVGKSAFMLHFLKNISELNENAYCDYISLDDSANELGPRYIACDQQITIGQAKNPKKYLDEPDIIERRNDGLKNMYKNITHFGILDSEDITSNIEDIEDHIKELRMEYGMDRKIVIGIDSLYDLTTKKNFGGNDKGMFEYITKELKSFCHTYDITICCTAHLRKLNGTRRPTNDDLKENNRLEYEANLICLMYNEVGILEESADVYWLGEDDEKKMPVAEVKFSKNKYSDFKGTRFYEMVPAQNYFMEASIESCKRYASTIHQR